MLGVGRTRAAKKRDAERLRETGRGEASRECQHRRGENDHESGRAVEASGAAQEGLEREPLAHEPIERWKSRDRDGSKQEQPRSPWRAPREPAELLHVEVVPTTSTVHPQEEGSGPVTGARMSKAKRSNP